MSVAQHLVIGIQGYALTQEEILLMQECKLAGVILFGRNIKSVEQLQQLIAHVKSIAGDSLLVSLDLEGGRVNRLSSLGLELPSAKSLALAAQAGQHDFIEVQARLIAQAMEFFGFNLNYAPVLDIDESLQVKNALNDRCWGENPDEVVAHVNSWILSFRKYSSALLVGKHFPGSGYAQSDPHEELPVIQRSLQELYQHELLPFVALSSQLDGVMSSHLLYRGLSEHPASLSSIDSELGRIRERLDFNGLWITDDLDMGAITKGYGQKQAISMAIKSGFHICLICHETEYLAELITSLPVTTNNVFDVAMHQKHTAKKQSDIEWQIIVNESHQLTKQVQAYLSSKGLEKPLNLPSSAVEDY